MTCPCVSQAVCLSATTASVVWPLAQFALLDVYPLASGILILDVVQTEKPLRLIAHRRVRFFTCMFVSTLVLEEGGKLIESNSSFGNILILKTPTT